MSFDPDHIAIHVKEHGRIIRLLVVEAAGSTPREAGTAMYIWRTGMHGTIGGGTLEHESIDLARNRLLGGEHGPLLRRIALGPGLGQCCGGAMTLLYESYDRDSLDRARQGMIDGKIHARSCAAHAPDATRKVETAIRHMRDNPGIRKPVIVDGWAIENRSNDPPSVWIFGAGHVGRAIVAMLGNREDMQVTWVDFSPERFPSKTTPGISRLASARPADAIAYAPADTHHLVLTHSHDLDLELCHRLLSVDTASIGLIGSATKWSRFRKRLLKMGHDADSIDRIKCPIGDPSLGKEPWSIALGVCVDLARRCSDKGSMAALS